MSAVEKKRRRREGERGLALLQTMLVMTFVMMTMLITVRQSSEALREGAVARKQTLIQGAIEHGVDHAIDQLQQLDPATLATLSDTAHDIFGGGGGDFVTPPPYPPAGDFAGQIEVHVGMQRGQRTQPPPGEDVAAAFGIIVDLQIQVTAPEGLFGSSAAEERVIIGVRVPHTKGGA
jgi:hypothetical protein